MTLEKQYFWDQADILVRHIKDGVITVGDIAACLQCLYSVGVIDSHLYTKEQKEEMYKIIKNVYHLETGGN